MSAEFVAQEAAATLARKLKRIVLIAATIHNAFL
jgi:hypothetical protein